MKNFLLSTRSREFFLFVFFVLIAAGFWLLQTLNGTFEALFSFPVRLREVPANVVITSPPPSQLQVLLRDKGTVLLNYMLSKKNFPITLDFTEYQGDNNHVDILSSTLSRQLMTQLATTTRIVSYTPDTLDYIYSTGASRRLPVRLQGQVTPGRQYYISDTRFTPDSIQVYAPQNVLDTMTAVYTERVTLTDISDTLQQHLLLRELRGVKLVPEAVDMTLAVDIYMEKHLEVPLHEAGFPEGKALRTFPAKANVVFQVGAKNYRRVTADDFYIEVSYDDLIGLPPGDKYTLQLKRLPPGIRNVRIEPSQVDFLIEQLSPDGR
jgi:YbbR domain-containing protein